MDTIQNRKLKKRDYEHGLEKSSLDSITTDLENDEDFSVIVDGKVITMAPDLKDLPEIDYDDPDVQKWLKEEDEKFREKFPNLTHAEVMEKVFGKKKSKMTQNGAKCS